MGLERRAESGWWYGRYEVDGKRVCKALGVRVRGKPGEQQFIQSEAKAQAKLDTLVEQAKDRQSTAEVIKQIHKLRTGRDIGSIEIDDMADEWEKLPRPRQPSTRHIAVCRGRIQRFTEYLQEHYPNVHHMHQVTAEIAEAYMAYQETRKSKKSAKPRKITGKTYNETLKQLKSLFHHLRRKGGLPENPFEEIPRKEEIEICRQPFSIKELHAIFEEIKDDEFLRPIVVTAICTAMRRGDCCQLKWADVDLEAGFITVKTSKTGATVDIPIFPALRNELEHRPVDGEYVFPDQADLYKRNPDEITQGVKKVIARALLPETKKRELRKTEAIAPDEIQRRALAYIDKLSKQASKARKAKQMRAVFEAYMDGAIVKETAARCGVSTGTAYYCLKSLQKATNLPILRRQYGQTSRPENYDRDTLEEREHGVRRGSVRDFHSFRVTWVTLALSAGVPMEVVKRVTGHKTTDVVLKHYFKPGKSELKETLQLALPNLLPTAVDGDSDAGVDVLPAGPDSDLEHAIDALKGLNSSNWKHRKAEAIEAILAARGRTEVQPLRATA